MNKTITFQTVYREPEPIWLKYKGIEFAVRGPKAAIFRMFRILGSEAPAVEELIPYVWKEYSEAKQLVELKAQREAEYKALMAEQRRLKDIYKARKRRQNKKAETAAHC